MQWGREKSVVVCRCARRTYRCKTLGGMESSRGFTGVVYPRDLFVPYRDTYIEATHVSWQPLSNLNFYFVAMFSPTCYLAGICSMYVSWTTLESAFPCSHNAPGEQ